MADKDLVWEAFHKTIPELEKKIEAYKEIVHVLEMMLWESIGYISTDKEGMKLRNRIHALYNDEMQDGFSVKAHTKRKHGPTKGD